MKTLNACGIWFYTGVLCIGIGVISMVALNKPVPTGQGVLANAELLYSATAFYGARVILLVGAAYTLFGLARARSEIRRAK